MFFALAVVLAILPIPSACPGAALPDSIEIVRPYGPTGRWSGHFGIDVALPPSSRVRSMGAGTVSFAGFVAGRRSVTVDHGGGWRTSYSYLVAVIVRKGQGVDRGSPIGYSGVHHGAQSVHLSLRSGTQYVDPMLLRSCSLVPHRGLWLTSVIVLYPGVRERNPRRHLRSSPLRPSRDRARSVRAATPRRGAPHGCWRTLAERGRGTQ